METSVSMGDHCFKQNTKYARTRNKLKIIITVHNSQIKVDRFTLQVLFFPLPTTPLSTSLKKKKQSNSEAQYTVSLNKFEDLIWHTVVPSFIDVFFSFFGVLTGQKRFQQGELPENNKMLLNKTTPRNIFVDIKLIKNTITCRKTKIEYLSFRVATEWMTCKL